MPRVPRHLILEDGSFFHVTWKCHNDDFLLREPAVKSRLYELLLNYKKKYEVQIFGYCFMDNHPHILGRCKTRDGLSRFFQVVNGCLARFINRKLKRRGQVAMDRFHSPRIQSEKHLLHALHYVDLNPVRAGICKRAKDYRWSSYRCLALGQPDRLLDPLPEGLRIEKGAYHRINQIIVRKHQKRIPIYTKTYFIGSPSWMKQEKELLFQRMKWKSTARNTYVTSKTQP